MRLPVLYFYFALVFFSATSLAQIPAFPGAEGWGATTPGGRGGAVLIVDKLSDDGSEGTLRWAVEQPIPRIIVFRVSGIIELTAPLGIGGPRNTSFDGDNPYSYVTIAGQSAPGGGIILTNFPISLRNDVHDIVIRHLRVRKTHVDGRLGSIGDGIEFAGCYNVVVDHCSVSWYADEGMSMESTTKRMNHDITVQHCLLAEGLFNGGHPSGGPHSRAMVASDGTFRVSMHHNLMVSNNRRNPSLGGNSELGTSDFPVTDVRFNVVYNFGDKGIQFARGAQVNIVGNIIRSGPQTRAPLPLEAVDRDSAGTRVFLRGNCWSNRQDSDELNCPDDQSELIFAPRGLFAQVIDTPFTAPPITEIADLAGYVLAHAGALPHDPADAKFINDYRNFTGNLGADSLSQTQITVEPPAAGAPPIDVDRDGMPDDWENARSLDPSDPTDASADRNGDGYTNIEEYLNERSPGIPTRVDEQATEIPGGFALRQNYPNPFNPQTTIRFTLPKRQYVTLNIFDVLGREVATLVEGELFPDEYSVDFDAAGLTSGLYFYQLTAGPFTQMRKAVLMR